MVGRELEYGDYLLAQMPAQRQPVKWWRVHRPYKCRFYNGMNKRWTVNLPHFSYHRTYVGYASLVIHLFNRWWITFEVGRYDREEYLAKGGKQRGLPNEPIGNKVDSDIEP